MQQTSNAPIVRALARWAACVHVVVSREPRSWLGGLVARGIGFALLVLVVRAGLPGAPDRDDATVLTIAILAALPWSLAVAMLDLDAGFGSRAAWVLSFGLVVNLSALAWCGRRLHRRLRGPRPMAPPLGVQHAHGDRHLVAAAQPTAECGGADGPSR